MKEINGPTGDPSTLQMEKLRLEILDLRRHGTLEARIGKFIPMIAAFVAVGGFFLTVWQAQRNDVLAREAQGKVARARINKLAQIVNDFRDALKEIELIEKRKDNA